MAGLTLPITCSLASLSCLPLLLWRSVVSGAMLLPIIFIMAFPGDIMKHGLIIHQTKYFIFMLLNSRAAACLQFIWVMVCIPNHRDLVFLCAVKASMQKSIMSLKLGFFSFLSIINAFHTTWSSGCSTDLHHRCDIEGWHLGYRCSTTEALLRHCLTADVHRQQVGSCS